jgi:hypothetical protein
MERTRGLVQTLRDRALGSSEHTANASQHIRLERLLQVVVGAQAHDERRRRAERVEDGRPGRISRVESLGHVTIPIHLSAARQNS